MLDYEIEVSRWYRFRVDKDLNLPNGYNCWDFWSQWYYPYIVKRNYAKHYHDFEKNKVAYKVVKGLVKGKKVKVKWIYQFIDLMDIIIKCL